MGKDEFIYEKPILKRRTEIFRQIETRHEIRERIEYNDDTITPIERTLLTFNRY